MRLVPLAVPAVQKLWQTIVPWLHSLEERFPDDWPIGEVARQVLDKTLMLWLVWDDAEAAAFGVVATLIQDKPSGRRILSIAAAGREAERWVARIVELEEYAAAKRCQKVSFVGRRGWWRWLSRLGYQLQDLATFEKDVRPDG